MAFTGTTSSPASWFAVSGLVRLARRRAVLAGALAAEVLLGAALVDERLARLVLVLVGIAGLVLVFRLPALATLGVLALTDLVFEPTFFPALPLGPANLRVHELVLGTLLLVAVVRPRRAWWGGPVGAALALFLAVIAVSGLLAVGSGRAPLAEVIAWSRPFSMLALFWVVIRLFPDPESRRRLLLGAAVLAAAAGVTAALISLGWSVGDSLQTAGDRLARQQQGVGGVDRVRLPGLSIGYALFWYIAVQAIGSSGARRAFWAALLACDLLGIAVSFNRNMWVGLFAGLVLLLVLGGVVVRARLLTALAVGLLGMALIGVVGSGLSQSSAFGALAERGQTIVSPKEVTRESSLRDRERESTTAWRTAVDNLALGVGPGASFGLFVLVRVGPQSFLRVPQLYLHNQYLYLLTVGGIPALVSFLLFLIGAVRRAWSRVPRDPSLTACGIGIAMIMMSAIVAIYFSVEDMTAPLGLLAGVIVAERAHAGAR